MTDDASSDSAGISDLTLLRVMVLKEIRTTFRERSQFGGLLVSAVMLVIAIAGIYRSAHHRHERSADRSVTATTRNAVQSAPAKTSTTKAAADHPPTRITAVLDAEHQRPLIRWAAIGGAALIGFFFSMGYLIAAVLASFVGEKEARTLEILLASPLSDDKLYLLKCASVLLPSATISWFFATVAVLLALAFIPAEWVELPWSVLFYALVLGLPVMLLPQLWFVGLGAAISIRAETVKGASQVLGAALMILLFGGVYGLPMLLATVPSVRPPVIAAGQWWLGLHFLAQYGSILSLFGVPAVVLIAIGRACFRRDRMLA